MTTPILAALTTLAVHLGSLQQGADRLAAPEAAPAVPKGTTEDDAPATTGSTELEGQGQIAAAEVARREAESTDATELEIAAGGLLSSGNAFAAAVTGQGRFRLRRDIHQFAAQVAGNYGYGTVERRSLRYLYEPTLADPIVEDEQVAIVRDPTIANLQGMMRYDVYFAKRWSAFAMLTTRRDRFQGLDLRLNVDPGVAFHVLTKARHRLWLEAGYDFQFDRRRQEAIFETRPVDPAAPDPTDPELAATERVRLADDRLINHAVRLFVGYNNSLSDTVTFDTGLEYLQSVLVAGRFRVNWVNALAIQLAGRFGVAATFTLRYENQPLPTIRKLDTITAVLLTMRFI
jgi:putative salt-induced outer membrane protein